MKLPFSLPIHKPEKKEYFLALLLRDEKAIAVIFQETLGKIQVIGEHEVYFNGSIEEASLDEMLDVLDKAISTAESLLPPNIETQKTIFGLKENWVEDAHIKKEYLARLKKISDVLGLIPVGFIVIHEAIAHLLQKDEGVPVSAVLVEIHKSGVSVSLFKAGKLLSTQRSAIEGSLVSTVDTLLHHFNAVEVLPSRIILFNGKDTDETAQEFISHSWSKSIPFLHVPHISVLPLSFDAKAVLFGAATQMGFDVAQKDITIQVTTHKNSSESTYQEPTHVEKKQFSSEERIDSIEMLGFVEDKDIAIMEKEELSQKHDNVQLQDQNVEEEKGEINNEHIEKKWKNTAVHSEQAHQSTSTRMLPAQKLSDSIKKIIGFIPMVKIPSVPGNKKIIFIPPTILFVVLLLLFFYIFALKAVVVLSFEPKNLEKKQNVVFTTELSDSSEILAETVSASVEGSVTAKTTGVKEVGESAKGTVTLYNSQKKELSLAKGTVITSSNDLEFTLDEAIKIASSAGASDGAKTAKVSVTARKIGKDYNLPSGTKFIVSSFDASDVEAKNESAFSGGTKKEIQVVAKTDTDQLVKKLEKELEGKAKDALLKSVSKDKSLLPLFVNVTLKDKKFDKDVGEEAKDLTLTATVVYEGLAYDRKTLEKLSKTTLEDELKHMTRIKNIEFTVENVKQNKNSIDATVVIKAFLIPKVDTAMLSKEIVGKSFEETENTLIKLPQASNIEISLQPPLPFLPKVLPKRAENITINTQAQE